ncbi:MAG: DUF962 domain-containing protein [Pseudomonadales bacterium]|nr:DUF962 domain-containing protein [Pseudomonadales bacterium]
MAKSRNIQEWFSVYGESHQNKLNKLIHFICVPAIYFSIIGILWAIPTPAFFETVPYLNFATLALVFVVLFYVRLSIKVAFGMTLFSFGCFYLLNLIEHSAHLDVLISSISIFVISWIFQFIGHIAEGKKPSFFEDLQFLMIGPAWVIGFAYRKIGIEL